MMLITPLLHDWETFYVIIGSSAAALTGLQFVGVALISEESSEVGGEEAVSAFGTPTVVHFCAVLLIAAICATPRHSATTLGLCLMVAAIAALTYTIRTVIQAGRQTGYKPVFEDWLFHAILPLIVYSSLLIAAICTFRHPTPALYIVAAAALLLLYVGIHNAWDAAVYLSTLKRAQKRRNPMNAKEAAVDFLRLAASANVREAYGKYAAPNFRHHNPYFKGDAESLMLGMEENAAKNPQKTLEVHHALRDGDLVAVHSHVRMNPNDRGTGLVHIFRFQGDRIAELWDLAQPVPEESPNENGMF